MRGDIIRFASDPVGSYEEWSQAADKWQFLRACFEIKDAINNPDHQSHLICELDQSTSGLQHMALVMDDVKMLKKVNIGPDYSDIYQIIGNDLELKGEVSSQHRRKIVKTAILPWSYGGGIKRIVEHYDELELPYLQDLSPTERFHLARHVVEKIEQHLLKRKSIKREWRILLSSGLTMAKIIFIGNPLPDLTFTTTSRHKKKKNEKESF